MAQKVMTSLIDDIDGSEAEGTVRFALDGDEYEIDLSPEHTAELRTELERYVAAARKSAGSRRPVRRAPRAASSGLNSTEVREWAKSQGIDVKERGRIPAELVVNSRQPRAAKSTARRCGGCICTAFFEARKRCTLHADHAARTPEQSPLSQVLAAYCAARPRPGGRTTADAGRRGLPPVPGRRRWPPAG
jgi:hypothetical protein